MTTPAFVSLPTELVLRYGDLTVTHEHLVAAGGDGTGEQLAARHVQRALDHLQWAHRLLESDGSAIVHPGEVEPV